MSLHDSTQCRNARASDTCWVAALFTAPREHPSIQSLDALGLQRANPHTDSKNLCRCQSPHPSRIHEAQSSRTGVSWAARAMRLRCPSGARPCQRTWGSKTCGETSPGCLRGDRRATEPREQCTVRGAPRPERTAPVASRGTKTVGTTRRRQHGRGKLPVGLSLFQARVLFILMKRARRSAQTHSCGPTPRFVIPSQLITA